MILKMKEKEKKLSAKDKTATILELWDSLSRNRKERALIVRHIRREENV